MAVLITIFSAGIKADLYYVRIEPKYEETINSYLSSNGCSAEYLPVSSDKDKAKHIINSVFNKMKFKLPSLCKPNEPLSLIEFLEDLMSKDYISTSCMTSEDRRKVKGLNKGTGPADTTTTANPSSPIFDSSFEDDVLNEVIRLENSKNALDQTIIYTPILDVLNKINTNLEGQNKMMKNMSKDVAELKEDMKEVRVIQDKHETALQQIQVKLGIESPVGGNAVNNSKHLCIYCVAEYHQEESCIWRIMKCGECGEQGHSIKVHRVTDPVLKERVRQFHGKRKFNFNV